MTLYGSSAQSMAAVLQPEFRRSWETLPVFSGTRETG